MITTLIMIPERRSGRKLVYAAGWQPIGNEEDPNLTIFFKYFLITPEGMDVDLGFSITL